MTASGVMRCHFRVLGGHVHCRVFGPFDGRAGELIFRIEEWAHVRALHPSWEFVDVTPPDEPPARVSFTERRWRYLFDGRFHAAVYTTATDACRALDADHRTSRTGLRPPCGDCIDRALIEWGTTAR